MKIKLFILVIVFSVSAKSQELTVFYKEKRVPAQVSNHVSDSKEVWAYINKHSNKIIARSKNPDSLRARLKRFTDSLEKASSDRKKHEKPALIPPYDFYTILKYAQNKSIYYPQQNVENDTIINQTLDEKGNTYTNGRINYNNSEIIYIDQYQKKKVTALKVHKFDLKGREFLIEEELVTQDWLLTQETKQIGKYQCYKAILNTNEKQVEAWYTTKIKTSVGPKGYHGLPGLILELKEGKRTVRFDKIQLLSSESIAIQPPKEGEKITREELEGLSRKLFNEY